MPARFYSFIRLPFPAVLSLVLGIVVALHASPALADPHAVFYTDRAQEQLFYNFLAALNQADYVEPGIIGSPYSRELLVQKRTGAPGFPGISGQNTLQFKPENNPTINATHTDLPSVVSRNVTLEGNDVWTAYLIQQFALETATRRSESELARVYCERGLGIIGCDISSPYSSGEKSSSFQTDSQSLNGIVNVGVDAILHSGTTEENNIRNAIATNNEALSHNASDPPYVPRPGNAELSALNQNIEANNQSIGTTAIDSIGQAINAASNGIDPETFTDVSIQDGQVQLANTIDTPEKYLDKVRQISNLPAQIFSVAEEGINKQLNYINDLTNTPVLASKVFNQAADHSGSLAATITNPSESRQVMLQALANLEANAVINQHYASSEAINNPGGQQLVAAPIPGATPYPPGSLDNLPNVSNIALNDQHLPTTNQLALGQPAQQGQVAGITTQQIFDLYNNTFGSPPQTALSPSVNAINPDRETGMFNALVALTDDTFLKDGTGAIDQNCSFCIQMDNILKSAYNGNYIGQLYCTLFPNTLACTLRQTVTPVPSPL